MKKIAFSFALMLAASIAAMAQVDIDKSINLSSSGVDAKISGIDTTIASKDAVNVKTLQRGSLIYAVSTNIGNAYSVSLSPAITSYTPGLTINFKANTFNTAAATLNVNGLGDIPIKKSISTDLGSNDINTGQIVSVIYDGTNFQLLAGSLPTNSGNYIQSNNVNSNFAVGQSASFDITGSGEMNGNLTVNGLVGIGMTSIPSRLSMLQTTNGTDGGLRTYNTSQAQWTAIYTGGDNSSYFQNQSGYISINNIGNIGIGTTSASAKLEVIGTVKMFGTRATLTLGTIYGPATTDGFVHVYGRLDGAAGLMTLQVNTGNSTPPTSVSGKGYSYNNGVTYLGYVQLSVPVRKGEYYQILCNGGVACGGSAFVGDPLYYFIPLGQ